MALVYQFRPDLVGVADYIPWFSTPIPFVWCYILIDADEITLLDTGMVNCGRAVLEWFRRQRRPVSQLKNILLSHGHSDHIGGVEFLTQRTGAPVWIHPLDVAIAKGTYGYSGLSRIGAGFEKMGRLLMNCRPPRHLRRYQSGQFFSQWGGLEVIALPGHTPGHVGFYSRSKQILFCGDALLCWGRKVALPLSIVNTNHEDVKHSALKLLDYPANWVYPMHHAGMKHNILEDVGKAAAKIGSGTT